jgi:SAM-dependent methyltransferase
VTRVVGGPEAEPGTPRLYGELAEWWPLLSAPEDYEEEAEFYRRVLASTSAIGIRTLLELGSGGGNNASHLKWWYGLTLVDRAPGMLAVSAALNPECEHVLGDMRSVRLGREFDAVFVHDAVCYMTTRDDLRRAMATAHLHCRPGGVALFAPDHVRESFQPGMGSGGHDGDGRGLRYLQWTRDSDPEDSVCTVDYAYLLRERDGSVRVVHDRHLEGLFPRDEWLRLLTKVGFEAERVPFHHSELPGAVLEVFVGRKPG